MSFGVVRIIRDVMGRESVREEGRKRGREEERKGGREEERKKILTID